MRQNPAAPFGPDSSIRPSLLSIFAFPQGFWMPRVRLPAGASDPLSSASARAQFEKFLNSIDENTPPITPLPPGPLALVNNFNYKVSSQAPDSAEAAYGSALAAGPIAAPSLTLPSAVGGITAAAKDSAEVLCLATFYPVFPGRVNFEVIPATATGTITAPSGATATTTMQIAAVAPGIAATHPYGTGAALPQRSG